MILKLVRAAEKKWRALNGSEKIAKLIEGYKFIDGIIQPKDAA